MIEDRPADPAASRRLRGVHGLQLRVVRVKLLQRADPEQLTAPAEAEERDRRIQETVDVKRMNVLGRCVRIGEREMALKQRAYVRGARVVNRDLTLRHSRKIRDQRKASRGGQRSPRPSCPPPHAGTLIYPARERQPLIHNGCRGPALPGVRPVGEAAVGPLGGSGGRSPRAGAAPGPAGLHRVVVPVADDVAMPLRNRVTPTGEIVADPARGLMMGNRGCLHGQGRDLGVSRWRSKLWICCVLEWKGVRRDPMPPGRWTALFFLDEATALAAGHRPCAYCRRRDFLDFAQAWRTAHRLDHRPRAGEMDSALHPERVDRARRQVTHHEPAAGLPGGVMIRAGGDVGLLVGGRFRPWSFRGYGAPAPGSLPAVVEVLTPRPIVAAIAAGYRPLVHPSALSGLAGARRAPRRVRRVL